jgi:hypothetical protein
MTGPRAGEDEYVGGLLDPRYDPIDDVMVSCGVCGSAVALDARRRHADWHQQLAEAAAAPLRRLAAFAEAMKGDLR